MSRSLIQCDEAMIPPHLEQEAWDSREHIRHRSGSRDLNFHIQNLSHACLQVVESRALDLVRIAAYVYGADQSIGRGGLKDVYARHWKRELALCIPVSDPVFWSNQNVTKRLQETLTFLTDDLWEFHFTQGSPEDQQLVLDVTGQQLHSRPDSVILFSGGSDSLCAVVESVAQSNHRPLLVSHLSTYRMRARQKRLVERLRKVFSGWDFPQIGVWIHRRGSEAEERTQRSRAFLYASLGAAIASQLGIQRVVLADNGIVSLNIPINEQLVGAQATRGTHPKFIHLFNQFVAPVLSAPVSIDNPLAYRTRSECLQILRGNSCTDLLQETTSCAHARGRPEVKPHCGVCSQCIDRRFGTIAAQMEEDDLPERYETDIFTQPLQEGVPRTMAESYVRFALDVNRTDSEDLLERYPQLYEAILPLSDSVDTASRLTSLLKRHSDQVLKVLKSRIATNVSALIDGGLPPTCLVRLVVSGDHLEDTREKSIQWLTRMLQRGLPPIFQSRRPDDEKDVQAATQGLLLGVEEKMGREVPLLPFAGVATKPDFSRAQERGWLYIEMKYPSSRPRLNQIVTEITSRSAIYVKQGAFALFAVYDPGRFIVDDQRFCADCICQEGTWVEVIR